MSSPNTNRARPSAGHLIALNAALLGILGVVSVAVAQPGNRGRGDYAMVGGEFTGGGSGNAIYILDASNEEIIAVRWDQGRKQLVGLGYRSLATDTQERRGR